LAWASRALALPSKVCTASAPAAKRTGDEPNLLHGHGMLLSLVCRISNICPVRVRVKTSATHHLASPRNTVSARFNRQLQQPSAAGHSRLRAPPEAVIRLLRLSFVVQLSCSRTLFAEFPRHWRVLPLTYGRSERTRKGTQPRKHEEPKEWTLMTASGGQSADDFVALALESRALGAWLVVPI